MLEGRCTAREHMNEKKSTCPCSYWRPKILKKHPRFAQPEHMQRQALFLLEGSLTGRSVFHVSPEQDRERLKRDARRCVGQKLGWCRESGNASNLDVPQCCFKLGMEISRLDGHVAWLHSNVPIQCRWHYFSCHFFCVIHHRASGALKLSRTNAIKNRKWTINNTLGVVRGEFIIWVTCPQKPIGSWGFVHGP